MLLEAAPPFVSWTWTFPGLSPSSKYRIASDLTLVLLVQVVVPNSQCLHFLVVLGTPGSQDGSDDIPIVSTPIRLKHTLAASADNASWRKPRLALCNGSSAWILYPDCLEIHGPSWVSGQSTGDVHHELILLKALPDMSVPDFYVEKSRIWQNMQQMQQQQSSTSYQHEQAWILFPAEAGGLVTVSFSPYRGQDVSPARTMREHLVTRLEQSILFGRFDAYHPDPDPANPVVFSLLDDVPVNHRKGSVESSLGDGVLDLAVEDVTQKLLVRDLKAGNINPPQLDTRLALQDRLGSLGQIIHFLGSVKQRDLVCVFLTPLTCRVLGICGRPI